MSKAELLIKNAELNMQITTYIFKIQALEYEIRKLKNKEK